VRLEVTVGTIAWVIYCAPGSMKKHLFSHATTTYFEILFPIIFPQDIQRFTVFKSATAPIINARIRLPIIQLLSLENCPLKPTMGSALQRTGYIFAVECCILLRIYLTGFYDAVNRNKVSIH
jgi:hypothetical protein